MPKRRPDRDQLTEELSDAIGAQVQERLLNLTGRRRLPDGVVTILFTDVEGSTSLVRSLGDEQARILLRRHDEEIRRAIEANDGTEVERAGGQILVSDVTKVLGDRAGFTFVDRGEWELKGLGGGHRVFELASGLSP